MPNQETIPETADDQTPELDGLGTVSVSQDVDPAQLVDGIESIQLSVGEAVDELFDRFENEDAETAEDITGEGQTPAPGLFGNAEQRQVVYEPDEATTDALQLFLNKIGKVPLLTKAQEVELAKRVELGIQAEQHLRHQSEDGHSNVIPINETSRAYLEPKSREELEAAVRDGSAAKQHMMEANLRLVVSVAKSYRGNGVPFMDLIQEGCIGLNRAVEKFDWRRGFKFSTYATPWIRQSVSRSIADKGRIVRIPVHVHDRLLSVNKTYNQLLNKFGREPTKEEIAEETGLSLDRVIETQNAIMVQPGSLNVPVGDNGDTELLDMLEDPDRAEFSGEDMVVSQAGRKLAALLVNRALEQLPPRERSVIELRYGLGDTEPRTLDEIGQLLGGLTRERIRQIESRALKRLRAIPNLEAELSDYDERQEDENYRAERVVKSISRPMDTQVAKQTPNNAGKASDPLASIGHLDRLADSIDGQPGYIISRLGGLGREKPAGIEELARHYGYTSEQIQRIAIEGLIDLRAKAKRARVNVEPFIESVYDLLFSS